MSPLQVAYQQLTQATTPLVVAQWLLLLAVPLLLLLASRRRRRNKVVQVPPSPPGLPIIGHLHLVKGLPYVSFRDLAANHSGGGGLMLLRLGSIRTLVVSSPGAAEAVMRTHDHVFASRHASSIVDVLFYGTSGIAFTPYGEYWRRSRKLVATHVLTVKKVQSYQRARKEEMRLVLAKIRAAAVAGGMAVDMHTMMTTFTNDLVSRAVSGDVFRAKGQNKLIRELALSTSSLMSSFDLGRYFPGLAKTLGFLSAGRFLRNRRLHETHKRWDELLETILSDHERRRNNSVDDRHDDDGGDFTDVLLSVQEEYGLSRDNIKAILLDMISAGTDTSALTLEFVMAHLMRSPQQMAKLQGEVRKHTPEGQETVEEENLSNMPYLRAVVKETLRLHPPAPLLAPHVSMADCVVNGYHVPAGTRAIINVWALARDPASWEKPEEFLPERFMDGGSAAGVDFKGNHFQFLPFGSGRRICPGINFAMAVVGIMLANLIYSFDWQLPTGMEAKDVDMTEVFRMSVHLKETLMLVPKLPAGADICDLSHLHSPS